MITIGDIAVHQGMPPQKNPYRGCGRVLGESETHVSGQARAIALRAFKNGRDTSKFTFWYAPASGGASQLTTITGIDWSGLRHNRQT